MDRFGNLSTVLSSRVKLSLTQAGNKTRGPTNSVQERDFAFRKQNALGQREDAPGFLIPGLCCLAFALFRLAQHLFDF